MNTPNKRYIVRKNTLHLRRAWCVVDSLTEWVVATRDTRTAAQHRARLLNNHPTMAHQI